MAPELSIVIPVFREQEIILETLEQIRALSFPGGFEVIVADGESPAGTLAHLRDSGQEGPGFVPVAAPRGRGPQMNAGVRASRGNILLFLHADTRMDQEGLDLIHGTARRSGPWFCGAFDLAIASPDPRFRIIERAASLRSRLTRLPYGDQAIFMSRAAFRRAGGYPDIPLMEDVAVMARLKKKRIRPVIFRHTVSTSARRWESQGLVYTTLRNWILVTLFFLGAAPERLARHY
jgi:rSAM/selenodomain-associated transferase 2